MRSLSLPALHATHAGIWLASGDGEVREASRGEAIARAAETPHIILNAPLVGQRLGYPDRRGLDLLELFAFIHPARFAVPTVAGLSRCVGLEPPASEAEAAGALAQDRRRAARRCSREPDWREREGAWTSNQSLHRLGWGWAPLIGARLERPERGERMLFSRLKQWEEAGRAAAAAHGRCRSRGSARPASKADRLAVRTARGPARDGRRRRRRSSRRAGRRMRPTCCSPRPARASARRSPISRRRRCGRRRRAGRCGSRPSPRRCSGSSTRRAAAVRRRRRSARRRIVVRKGRENYLCLLNLEDALQGAFAGRAAILAQLVGRWAAYTQGRRHGRRRPARLAAEPVPPRRRDRADRPARRMRLCRLPALPPLLHRARRAGEPRGRHRHRQPCAGDGQCRARRARTRRSGSCSTRAITCSTPPIRPSRSRFGGQEAIEMRRWIVGPEGKSRGRRRGLAARLMDVASYDDEGASGARRGGRGGAGAAVGRLAAAARRGRAVRAGRGACSARCAARSMRAPRRRRRATGSRPSWPSPTARWSPRRRRRSETLEALQKPLAALGRRLEAVLEDAPDWLDSPGAGAGRRRDQRPFLAARDACGLDRAARRGSAATADPEFVDWLAIERVEGREYDVGDPPPLARSDQAARRGGAQAGAWRAGDLGDAARRRWTGRGRGADRRAASAATGRPFRGGKPVRLCRLLGGADRHRREAGRHRGAGRRLCAADRGGRRRHARAVHRDPAAEGGACAHRRPAGARRACRCSPSMSIRSMPARWSTSSATIRAHRCSAPMRLRDGVDVPGESLRLVVMERVPVAAADRAPRGAADGGRRQRL